MSVIFFICNAAGLLILSPGYAFVHFKTAADAEEFTSKLSNYKDTKLESRRATATTLAAHQGVTFNLTFFSNSSFS